MTETQNDIHACEGEQWQRRYSYWTKDSRSPIHIIVVVLFIIVTCVYIVHIYIYKQMYIVNTPSPFGLISHSIHYL